MIWDGDFLCPDKVLQSQEWWQDVYRPFAWPWNSPEENVLVRCMTGQPEAYKNNSIKTGNENLMPFPPHNVASPSTSVVLELLERMSLWLRKEKRARLQLLWGRAPVEASVPHPLDHPLFGLFQPLREELLR